MNRPIRWGILGTGSMASAFARGLSTLPDARLEAVGSRRAEAAERFAQEHGVARSIGSYDAVAHDPDIDVIYVATINTSHAALSCLCLDAGKPILCEKPFAVSADEARQVVETARRTGLFGMEAMWMRFLPGFARLKELLDSGAIGTPRLLDATIGYPFMVDPTGRLFDPSQGGGALLDIGVYPLSMAFALFGPPETVHARAGFAETGVDDAVSILLGFPEGRIATLTASLSTATPNTAMIMGTRGQVLVHEPFIRPHRLTLRTVAPVRLPSFGSGSGGSGRGLRARLAGLSWARGLASRIKPVVRRLTGAGRPIVVPYAANGYQYQAIEVMRCLQAGLRESPVMPLDETVRILETIDEIRRQWGAKSVP